MALIYDLKEFATAVKPFLLARLLEDGGRDRLLRPRHRDLRSARRHRRLARERGIVLTPHTAPSSPRRPAAERGDDPPAGRLQPRVHRRRTRPPPFLDWWGRAPARDCLVAVEEGIFVDQRWIDFVPALFEHAILRDPGCNVAYWNLSPPPGLWTPGGYEVNGQPLRFYHYSGFTPDRSHLLSAHMGTVPRILLEDLPDVRRLCDAYARRLREQGFGHGHGSYRFDALPNGLPIDPAVRATCATRSWPSARREDPVPDPFDPRAGARSCGGSAPPSHAGVPRYLDALYRRRGDLRHAFPNVSGAPTRAVPPLGGRRRA